MIQKLMKVKVIYKFIAIHTYISVVIILYIYSLKFILMYALCSVYLTPAKHRYPEYPLTERCVQRFPYKSCELHTKLIYGLMLYWYLVALFISNVTRQRQYIHILTLQEHVLLAPTQLIILSYHNVQISHCMVIQSELTHIHHSHPHPPFLLTLKSF